MRTEVFHKAWEIIQPPQQKTNLKQLGISYNAEDVFCLSLIGASTSSHFTSLSASLLETNPP